VECIGATKLDRLSNILKAFNEQIDTLIDDGDRIVPRTRDDIGPKVAATSVFKYANEHTSHTARLTHDHALGKAM
jgi:type I restriction enzyme R subunit